MFESERVIFVHSCCLTLLTRYAPQNSVFSAQLSVQSYLVHSADKHSKMLTINVDVVQCVHRSHYIVHCVQLYSPKWDTGQCHGEANTREFRFISSSDYVLGNCVVFNDHVQLQWTINVSPFTIDRLDGDGHTSKQLECPWPLHIGVQWTQSTVDAICLFFWPMANGHNQR